MSDHCPSLVITPEELAIVRGILARHLPGREVRAFGSRVRGKARKYSDLDLVVMGDQRLTLTQLALLEEDFSESLLPFKVDVVDWAGTRPEFRAIIEEAWVVVQEAEGKEQWA